MSLTDEERQAIVVYRLEKADHAIIEAKDCVSMWHWTQADVEPYISKVEEYVKKIKSIIKGL